MLYEKFIHFVLFGVTLVIHSYYWDIVHTLSRLVSVGKHVACPTI